MRKPEVLISIDTLKDWRDEQFLSVFFQKWFRDFPKLAPEYAGIFEPIRERVFEAAQCINICMADPFIWKRKSDIASEGIMSHGGPHFCAAIRIRSSWDSEFVWEEMFDWLCEMLNPEFGYLHLITDEEKKCPGISPQAAQNFFLGAHMKGIEQNGIPNLGWKTYFGESVVKRFSIDVSPGSSVTVSKKLDDIQRDFETFSECRANISERIGLNIA